MLISVACLLLAPLVSLSGQAAARFNHSPLPIAPKMGGLVAEATGPVRDVNGQVIPPYDTVYYFDQLIDHNDPGKGTFKVRYWTTWEFYKPGGPIILGTPGEGNAEGFTGYLTNRTINGQIAQQENGATIVIEHRFYGSSNPYPDLSVKSLAVHTLDQAIEDFDYFAKNVKLPFPGGDQVGPAKAPWIFIGGSYSGALASWVRVAKPQTFYAAYSSSGVVQAITDFWAYFEPVRQHMPANCSADVQAVVAHVDGVLSGKNTTAISQLKDVFGLGGLSHLDDVASALQVDLYKWQGLQPNSGPNSAFFQFCDALEVKNGVSAPASGWGLEYALPAWGNHFKTVTLPDTCPDDDIEACLGTYNPNDPFWTDTSVNNAWRSWFWTVCHEFGWFQTGAPSGPTLVSRLVRPIYSERQCTFMFKDAFAQPPVPNTDRTNSKYQGWNVKADRLFLANGHQDPWREATISAESQHFVGTPLQPIEVSNGFHCSDMATSARIDPTVAAVQDKALASFKTWLGAWPKYKRELEAGVAPQVRGL